MVIRVDTDEEDWQERAQSFLDSSPVFPTH